MCVRVCVWQRERESDRETGGMGEGSWEDVYSLGCGFLGINTGNMLIVTIATVCMYIMCSVHSGTIGNRKIALHNFRIT